MVSYHSDIDFSPGVNSVVIVDESDEHIFGNPVLFHKFSKKAPLVCLTATCAEDSTTGIER